MKLRSQTSKTSKILLTRRDIALGLASAGAAVATPNAFADKVVAGADGPEIAKRMVELMLADIKKDPRELSAMYRKAYGDPSLGADSAWCSICLRYYAKLAGADVKGVTAAAKSWLKVGAEAAAPQFGTVVVLHRGDPNGPFGHVGLYVGEGEKGLLILGGNQGEDLNRSWFDSHRVAGFRMLTKSRI